MRVNVTIPFAAIKKLLHALMGLKAAISEAKWAVCCFSQSMSKNYKVTAEQFIGPFQVVFAMRCPLFRLCEPATTSDTALCKIRRAPFAKVLLMTVIQMGPTAVRMMTTLLVDITYIRTNTYAVSKRPQRHSPFTDCIPAP